MFCPKCGVENLNTSKFCRKCGKNLPNSAQLKQNAPVSGGFPNRLQQQGGLIGQVLDGKYRIDAKLGSGGMGDVYRATRLFIGDAVAIKILHPHLARDAQAAERFRREAVTATQLRHRNIVGLFDVGISAVYNVPYILMELAEGFSLRQIINQYRVLPLDFVVTVTAQVCGGLEEAHRLGIVHRDIKPENIIANQTPSGWNVKILDFGIAKLYNQADIGLTQDGSAMGTPQYMSPEQCLGEALDGRSDIYSVGILLYEMLAGTVPFKAPVASAIAVHQVQTQPAPPSSANPNIAPQVENVVLRALSKQRELRPQTASILAQEMIQAATAAFKSGLAPVSTTPIAAPDVEPEFDASGESLSEPQPAGSSTLSSEFIVAPEPTEVADEEIVAAGSEEPSTPATDPVNAIAPKAKTTRSRKKKARAKQLNDDAGDEGISFVSVPDVGETPPETAVSPSVENIAPEDLTLVFEDAEHLLDEIFPDEAAPKVESKPADPNSDDSEAGTAPNPVASASADSILTAEDSIFHELPPEQPTAATPELATVDAVALNEDSSSGVEAKAENESESKTPTAGFAAKNLIIIAIGAVILLTVAAIAGGVWLSRSGSSALVNDAKNPTNEKAPAALSPPAGMAFVSGGEFLLGNDDGDEYSRPAHKVTVRAFFIDLYEVTNEEYKKFVDATNQPAPRLWKNKEFPEGQSKLPVTGVDWDAATAYAKWAGKRLPTEEEWEFAARGTDNRIYPWGGEWNNEMANAGKQRSGVSEVGKFAGNSPFGLSDMSGNVWEWTASAAEAYPGGKKPASTAAEPKIIRGGFFGSSRENATVFFRRPYGARGESGGYDNTGFRCVKDVPDR